MTLSSLVSHGYKIINFLLVCYQTLVLLTSYHPVFFYIQYLKCLIYIIWRITAHTMHIFNMEKRIRIAFFGQVCVHIKGIWLWFYIVDSKTSFCRYDIYVLKKKLHFKNEKCSYLIYTYLIQVFKAKLLL